MSTDDKISEIYESMNSLRIEITSVKNDVRELLFCIQMTDQNEESISFEQSKAKSSFNNLVKSINRINSLNVEVISSDLSDVRSEIALLAKSIDRAHENISKLARIIDEIGSSAHTHTKN